MAVYEVALSPSVQKAVYQYRVCLNKICWLCHVLTAQWVQIITLSLLCKKDSNFHYTLVKFCSCDRQSSRVWKIYWTFMQWMVLMGQLVWQRGTLICRRFSISVCQLVLKPLERQTHFTIANDSIVHFLRLASSYARQSCVHFKWKVRYRTKEPKFHTTSSTTYFCRMINTSLECITSKSCVIDCNWFEPIS